MFILNDDNIDDQARQSKGHARPVLSDMYHFCRFLLTFLALSLRLQSQLNYLSFPLLLSNPQAITVINHLKNSTVLGSRLEFCPLIRLLPAPTLSSLLKNRKNENEDSKLK